MDSLLLDGFCNWFRLFCGCKVVKDETGLFEAEAFGEIETEGLGVNSTFDSWSSKLMSVCLLSGHWLLPITLNFLQLFHFQLLDRL